MTAHVDRAGCVVPPRGGTSNSWSHPRSVARTPATRVLFVDNQVDDFVRYRMSLARSLQGQGLDIHVALPQEPGLDRIHAGGRARP